MTRLSVPDMSCGHCKASVEAALAPLGALVVVDLPNRQVKAEGAAPEAMIKALAAVGFPATVLA
jgi:copper chaperone